MAITIPILTTFNGRGLDRGIAQFKSLETKGQKANFLLRKAAIPAAAALGGLALGAKAAVAAASDLGEETSKSEAIFGKTAATVQKFAGEQGAAFGLSKTAALDAANSMAVYGKAAGLTGSELGTFSTDLVKLSGDLASFSNVDVQTAADALKSGLAGESEPLKKFGILMNDATLKATALKMGLIKTTKDALTPQQKVLAANRLIFEQTTDAQGDAARTSGSFANRQRQLTATLENMKAELGTALLPIVEKFAGWLTKVAGFLANNTGLVKAAAAAIGVLAAGVLAANAAVKVWTVTQNLSNGVTKLFTGSTKGLNAALRANPIGLVVTALGLLIPAIKLAYDRSESFRGAVDTLFSALKGVWDFLSPIAETAFNGLKAAFGAIRDVADSLSTKVKAAWDVIKPVVNFMKPILSTAFNGLKTAFNVLFNPIEKVKTAISVVSSVGGPIIEALKKVGSAAFNGLKGAFNILLTPVRLVASALERIKSAWEAISGVWSSITGAISGTAPQFHPITGQPIRRSAALMPANLASATAQSRGMVVNVQIDAGLVSTPDQVGQQIIEAIQRAQRKSGPAFVAA